ncbi:tyrosine-type recombinase/integrase [Winogradskyella sp. A2]|uniref:tyrosine-type recombinase/integrase n=1 Tax=Winogradskyella sp. A2 TaxID=3366944 RepID=UPI00398C26DF
MATIKYQIQSKSENAPIYLRLSLGRKKQIKRKTGLHINCKDWSDKGFPKQTTPQNKNLTSKLKKLEIKILDKINDANSKGQEITGDWLLYHIDLHFERISENNQSELIIDTIQNIIDTSSTRKNAKGGLGLSKSRINSYRSLKGLIIDFSQSKRYKIKEVNIKFANDFLEYLIKEKDYSKSYAIKKVADLKTVCYNAETNGITINQQFKKIESTKVKNQNIVYLSPSELYTIEQLELTNQALINARKWLLLGCNIGQRGGDLLRLTESNFVKRNGYEVIELEQQKTGKNVTIPVLNTTKNILQNGLPYTISIQKLNNYIKEICKLAEINEMTEGGIYEITEMGKGKKQKRKVYGKFPKYKLITSHVCRRSFATNLYGELPTNLIMQITGHSTEKMLLNYIGKNSLDYAQQIADFYILKAQKEKKEPHLSIVKQAK